MGSRIAVIVQGRHLEAEGVGLIKEVAQRLAAVDGIVSALVRMQHALARSASLPVRIMPSCFNVGAEDDDDKDAGEYGDDEEDEGENGNPQQRKKEAKTPSFQDKLLDQIANSSKKKRRGLQRRPRTAACQERGGKALCREAQAPDQDPVRSDAARGGDLRGSPVPSCLRTASRGRQSYRDPRARQHIVTKFLSV